MHKTITSPNAQVTTIVEITPSILREYANRIEDASKHATPGTSVLCPFTHAITFRFSPEIPTHVVFGSYLNKSKLPLVADTPLTVAESRPIRQ
jgi:hypothetical protein